MKNLKNCFLVVTILIFNSNFLLANECIFKTSDSVEESLEYWSRNFFEKSINLSWGSFKLNGEKTRVTPIIYDMKNQYGAPKTEDKYFIWLSIEIKGNDAGYFYSYMLIDKCKKEFVQANPYFDKDFETTDNFQQALEKVEDWTKVALDKNLLSYDKKINDDFTFKFSNGRGWIESIDKNRLDSRGNPKVYSSLDSPNYTETQNENWGGLKSSQIPGIQKLLKEKFTSELLDTAITQLTGSNVSDDDFK